jgi:hypothetical protein
MNINKDVLMNPYLVQLSERKEPEFLTNISFSLGGVKFKNVEFDIIQSNFERLTEEQQFSAYRETNKHLFGWMYFAPYQVLENLKDEEKKWYDSNLMSFYEHKDFKKLLDDNYPAYGFSEYDRDPSVTPFCEDDSPQKRLKQEKFMTAQFCWWKRNIWTKYPIVWKKMEERFYKNYEWNWLVEGGELKDYIHPQFSDTGTYYKQRGRYVKGAVPWVKLRKWYKNIFQCFTHEKWYTLWDCNIEIFRKNKQLSFSRITWSNNKPTFNNTNDIWLKIKNQIHKKIRDDTRHFPPQPSMTLLESSLFARLFPQVYEPRP